jgi:hypothetical protein
MKLVALATEDELSEAVGRRLLIDAGHVYEPAPVLRKNGFGYLRSKMDSWCDMAKRKPFVLLTDLDQAACPIELRAAWLGGRQPSENFVFRIAVREVEAWLLADHEAMRSIIGAKGTLPPNPDLLSDPKKVLLGLVAKLANREIRADLVADAGAIASQGIGYNARLSQWVAAEWNPERAAIRSNSLHRARIRLGELVKRMHQTQDFK